MKCSVQFECDVDSESLVDSANIIEYTLKDLDLYNIEIIYIDEV